MSTITGNGILNTAPTIIDSITDIQISGTEPNGYRIECMGIMIDETQRDPNGQFALAFQFNLPAGVKLAGGGSDGQAFDLTTAEDRGQLNTSILYWGIWYLKSDYDSGSWEVDFKVSTPTGSSTYTLTRKRTR